jgi:hypothetical protein
MPLCGRFRACSRLPRLHALETWHPHRRIVGGFVRQKVRQSLNRPLTLAEKIVYGHLDDGSVVRVVRRAPKTARVSVW